MKIYAKQVSPEYQESPLYMFNEYPENVTVTGNRDFKEHIADEFQQVFENLENGECAEMLEQIKNNECNCYNNKTDCILDYFPPIHKKNYSTKEIKELSEIISEYNYCNKKEEDYYICRVLSLRTGDEYECECIRGCFQSDWNYVYYPKNKYENDFISKFEIEYFNIGSEWIIHDYNNVPERAEEIKGYSRYCYEWDIDKIKEEIAKENRVSKDDVVLYQFNGYQKISTYKIV